MTRELFVKAHDLRVLYREHSTLFNWFEAVLNAEVYIALMSAEELVIAKYMLDNSGAHIELREALNKLIDDESQ
jgi:hypothetical protein